MECVLAVNSLLRRHCGQSLSGVGAGLSDTTLILALATLLKTTFCLGLPLFTELLCMQGPRVHPKLLDTIL